MKYVVLTIGCITQVSPGSLNPFSPWYLSSDNKEYFCLLWLSQNLQPFVPACLIQVFSWQVSSTSPFSFYFGFLDHCLPFRKVLGLPCAIVLGICHGNTEHRVPRVQAFIAAQVGQPPGVEMCCVPWWNQRPLALSLGVPPDHLIAETLGCLLLRVSVMIFSSFSTYLLNTYTQDTEIDMTCATMTLCRYSITSAAMFNSRDGEQQ